MTFNTTNGFTRGAAAALMALGLAGCAATIGQEGLEQRTSLAIGRPVGSFSIGERSEETGGRINYSAKTRDGATYHCYMYSATGFQRAMSFGQTPHSDAICTSMGKAGRGTGGTGGTGRGLQCPAQGCQPLLSGA